MEDIYIEQFLYGYNNGHSLLATSMDGKLLQQKELDVLSDSSGAGKFVDYITCFPLIQDGIYAFSKTWYADEMQRPGCVWTHILLISFENLEKINGRINLSELFSRPTGDDFTKYRKKIHCNGYGSIESINIDYIYYFLYTLLYSGNRVIIGDDNSSRYEKAILDVLVRLPIEILQKFSICTKSFSNRYIEGELFSYQITERATANILRRDIKDASLYKNINDIDTYPLWVKYIANKMLVNEEISIYRFCRMYDSIERTDIKELVKILYAVDDFKNRIEFEKYIEMLMKLEKQEELINKTYDLIFAEDDEVEMLFEQDSIIDYVLNNLLNNKKKNRIDKRKLDKYAIKIYSRKNSIQILDLFTKYIHNELNSNGKYLVSEIIELMVIEDLELLFEMDLKICSVLIKKKPMFLLNKKIWRCSKEYQLEILGCVPNKVSKKKEIIECILTTSNEDIEEDVYECFGEVVLEVIANCCKKNELSDSWINRWVSLLAKNQKIYLETIKTAKNMSVIYAIMKCIDSYSIKEYYELHEWVVVVSDNLEWFDHNHKDFCSVFMLPIIIKYNDYLSQELIYLVHDAIHEKLKNNLLEYKYWKKIEKLLPEVPVEQSWDKCLRLRLAFNDKL